MILSFPIDAWLLLFVAVGLGLGLEVAFYRSQRARRARAGTARDAAAEPDARADPDARATGAEPPDPGTA